MTGEYITNSKVHTFFVKNKFCVTNIVFKTFVVNGINFMHYIYFIFMLYTLFVNATVCKHYKVKILKMNANRTNRSKVINRAIHILFHGRINKLLTYYCLNDLVPSYNKYSGLKDKKKRDLVFNWLVAKQIDVICLQETH